MITYTTYQSANEMPIVELWNRCLLQDPITKKRFRNLVLLDANFDLDGLFLAWDGSLLVGFLYAVRRQLPMRGIELEPESGWITSFAVDREYRRQGIGTRLMNKAVEWLRSLGRTDLFFSSYAPNYIVPGIDINHYPEGLAFLESVGFEKLYSPVAMDRTLNGFELPEAVTELKKQRISEGYSFETAEDGDLYECIQFASNVFNPDWGRAIREGVLNGLPLSRIHIVRQRGTLVGFCMHGGYEGIDDRFGPFGVDPNQQGKGLGKILLYDCLSAMRSEGLHGAWFLWTGEQSPAGHLYKKAGFQVTRTFQVMKRTV